MNKNYQIITDRILAELEKGNIPWKRQWSAVKDYARNYKSKAHYRGCNWMMLNLIPWQQPYFLTFKQAKAAGAFVRKGESGTPVFFWGKWQPSTDDGGKEDREQMFLKRYTVFNASQLEGAEKLDLPELARIKFSPIRAAEFLLEQTQLQLPIKEGIGRACYSPTDHEISIPARDTFRSPAAYYEVLFHELTHATKSALGRKQSSGHGDAAYAFEELIAELGSAFLCAACGIDGQDVPNKAAYISSWMRHLSNDAGLFYRAASAAQKAADYILEGVDFDLIQTPEITPAAELIPAAEIPFNLVSEERPDTRPALESARRSRDAEQSQLTLF